jgi:predicted Zn-dependent protease with MMP-like domain
MTKHRQYDEQEFEELVRSALDDLPIEFQRALENVAIVVSDRGAEHHAYGMYIGLRMGGQGFFGGGGVPTSASTSREFASSDCEAWGHKRTFWAGARASTRRAQTIVTVPLSIS